MLQWPFYISQDPLRHESSAPKIRRSVRRLRGIPPSKRAPPSFELLSLLDHIILQTTAKLSTHRPLDSSNAYPASKQKHHHTTPSEPDLESRKQ
ncbi:hypothetical protein D0861_03869 [Hortaea werneckii]|uniref:Uncharacterized protein n=1 Tax=Hortaea werneckii TaxID=91943 RepID=A0A3M7FMH1_HORWE|nr:hypothetical protein D0861_03869 [Hortaea werneckii]